MRAPVIRNTHMWRSAACSNDIYMWEREAVRAELIHQVQGERSGFQ